MANDLSEDLPVRLEDPHLRLSPAPVRRASVPEPPPELPELPEPEPERGRSQLPPPEPVLSELERPPSPLMNGWQSVLPPSPPPSTTEGEKRLDLDSRIAQLLRGRTRNGLVPSFAEILSEAESDGSVGPESEAEDDWVPPEPLSDTPSPFLSRQLYLRSCEDALGGRAEWRAGGVRRGSLEGVQTIGELHKRLGGLAVGGRRRRRRSSRRQSEPSEPPPPPPPPPLPPLPPPPPLDGRLDCPPHGYWAVFPAGLPPPGPPAAGYQSAAWGQPWPSPWGPPAPGPGFTAYPPPPPPPPTLEEDCRPPTEAELLTPETLSQ